MGNISRRDFLKGSAAGAIGLAMLGAVPAAAEEAAPAAEAAAMLSGEGLMDGSYFTSTISMHGEVSVQTDIADGMIAGVKVLNHHETWVVGEAAVNLLPAKIVEAQSIGVDAITGATVTSSAILRCVSQAIEQAGGDPDDYYDYEDTTEKSEEIIEKEADVVIIGAGPAGFSAAFQLAEAGKSVIMVEKMPFFGGCLPMTSTAWTAVGTKLHKAYGEDRAPLAGMWWSNIEAFRENRRSSLDPEDPRYNPDMPYYNVLVDNGPAITDAYVDLHVPFMPIQESYVPQLSPGQFSVGGKNMLTIVRARLDALGVEILLETPATELTVEDGKVVGCKAVNVDGTTYMIKAKATLLASGGFIMNNELMKEYNPDDLKYTIMGPKWATGDGMLMAKEIGAGWDCMECGVTSHYSAGKSLAEISYLHYLASPGVVVNGNGQRFVSESLEYKVALKEFKKQDSDDFYWIFDERGRQGLAPSANIYKLDYRFLFETGEIIEAENVEALQELTGLSGLADTMRMLNANVEAGVEDEFGNAKLKSFLLDGKMYALKVIPTPYIAQGGVKIDTDTHVQREDDSIIEGLYAAGDVTGSIECRDGSIYRIGLAQALTYGYQAYKTIMAEI